MRGVESLEALSMLIHLTSVMVFGLIALAYALCPLQIGIVTNYLTATGCTSVTRVTSVILT